MFDLRLLPLAFGLWVGAASVCFTAGGGNARAAVVAALVGLALPALVSVSLAVAARQRWVPELASGNLLRSAVLVVLVGLAFGSAIGLARVTPLHAEPLSSIVAAGQKVSGDAKLLEVPKSKSRADGINDKAGAISWWVQADLVVLRAGGAQGSAGSSTQAGASYNLSVPVSLRGIANDAAAVANLTPGAVVSFTGTAQPGLPARAQAASIMIKGELQVVEPAPVWQRWGSQVRSSMVTVAASAGGAGGNLLPGLVAGDESQLDEQTVLAMRDTGLAHLTAVSGSNIAVVTGMVLALGFALRLPRLVALAAAFAAMIGFVIVVGAQPSVLRATAMATVVLATLAFKRDRDALPSLLLSISILLLIDPWLSLSLGFALSVAATAGIIAAGKFYEQSARDLAAKLKAAVIVTVAAQVATTPIIASMGNGIPLIGIVANLLAMPAVPIATVVGLAAAGFGLLHLSVGNALAQLAAMPAQWIASVATFANKVPGGLLAWPGGVGSAVITSLMTLTLLLVLRYRRQLGRRLSLVVVALVLVAASLYAGDPLQLEGRWLPSNWRVVVCDVGQGDASVIKTGDGRAIVVDVGGADAATDSCLQELKIATIDLLILSHFHADHVGGLNGALARRDVTKVIGSPLPEPPGQTGRVRKILAEHGAQLEVARPGQSFKIGQVTVELLWPAELVSGPGSAPNNASVVAKVSTPGLTILFPGDIEPAAQERLIDAVPPIGIDVVKVPHHGSKNQSQRLPEWAGARWAIMSAGAKNNYGHPHPKAIELFERAGAKIVRTDTMGAIAIVPGGTGVAGNGQSDPDILVKGIQHRADP